jgi:hypothetical protein
VVLQDYSYTSTYTEVPLCYGHNDLTAPLHEGNPQTERLIFRLDEVGLALGKIIYLSTYLSIHT